MFIDKLDIRQSRYFAILNVVMETGYTAVPFL